MTDYSRGDVVLVRYPYADLKTWGRRPALVVQADAVRTELGHYVLAQITSTPRSGPTRISVARDSAAGQLMNLQSDSVIVLDMLQTVEATLLDKRIGICPLMEAVDTALRILLSL